VSERGSSPRHLPEGARRYSQTRLFTERDIPAGLLHEYRTKPRVWGLIRLVAGRLRYRILDPFEEIELGAKDTAVIAPQQPHEVEPVGGVRFYTKFYTVDRIDPRRRELVKHSPEYLNGGQPAFKVNRRDLTVFFFELLINQPH